jgi:hypothetical protein
MGKHPTVQLGLHGDRWMVPLMRVSARPLSPIVLLNVDRGRCSPFLRALDDDSRRGIPTEISDIN